MTERRVPSRRTFLGQSLLGLGGLPASAGAQPSPPGAPARPLSGPDRRPRRSRASLIAAFRRFDAGRPPRL